MKILLVEDDSLMRDSIKKFLEFKGYKVETASNGKEAIVLMEKTHYTILITDILMPKMGGKELIKYVKNNFKDISIIAISGYIDEIEHIGEKSNPDFILQKPFDLNELLNFIEAKT